jgi:hypothetical protein
MTYAVAGRRTSLAAFLFPERYDSTGTVLGEVNEAGLRACGHYFSEQTVSRRPQVLESVFRQLADEWIDDTQFQSSLTRITSHPSYRKLISFGNEVVPLILRDLAASPRPWFAALREITGADPVRPNERGNVAAMADSWLRWARANNIQW